MIQAQNRSSVELFAYPWDILDRGPEAFVDECCTLGVTAIHSTTLYHSGKFLLPRNGRTKVYFPEPGRFYIPVNTENFPNALRPSLSAMATSGWLDRFARAASGARLQLSAWTVFFHSSTLATAFPEWAVQNLFGDLYPFALCPSNPEVQAYGVAVASGIRALGVFERLDVETIGYLGYNHGHHHEVTGIPAGILENFLLSLCFCRACCCGGAQAGVDMEELRLQLQNLLKKKLAADDAASCHPDNVEQPLTLVVLTEPLQKFLRFRMANVSSLTHQIKAAFSGGLNLFSSSFVGSPSNIWMEGLSLPELRTTTDVFHLLAYSANTDSVNSDLAFCLAQIEDASRLNLTLNLGLSITPTLAHALAKIEFARRQGVRRFGLFNYGFLGEARLAWVKQIAQVLS